MARIVRRAWHWGTAALRSNRVFCGAVAVVCGIAFALNLNHSANRGMLHYYEEFADFILSGFHAVPPTPTFPMWGYGWVLWLVGGSWTAVWILQFVACIATTFLFVRVAEQALPSAWTRYLRPGVVASLPWYFFHSVLQPNVPAADLLVGAVALIVISRRWWSVVLSGLGMGLALNFRSDFVFLPLVLFGMWWWGRSLSLRRLALWIGSIAVVLIPWAFHCWITTGTPQITSTNSGHVLYISLGQMPGNVWARTCADSDPQMAALLKKTFHSDTVHSCSPAANVLLRRAFLDDVRGAPAAYAVRCASVFAQGITGGFYPGELLNLLPEHHHAEAEALKSTLVGWVMNTPGGNDFSRTVTLLERGLVLASLGSSLYARGLLFFGVLAALSILILPRVRAHLMIRTVTTVAVYQIVMCVAVYANPMYFSASYLFFLLCLVVVSAAAGESRAQKRAACRRKDALPISGARSMLKKSPSASLRVPQR